MSFLAGLTAIPSGFAAETRVTLFGQSCVLTGPFEAKVLNAIHSVSPDQISPIETGSQVRRAIARVKAASGLPQALDLYKERLFKRLEAQSAFFQGLASARKSGKSADLLSATKPFLSVRAVQEFDASVKRLEARRSPKSWADTSVSELRDWYFDVIAADPEEDFHRAIRKLDVKYMCSYEEDEAKEQ